MQLTINLILFSNLFFCFNQEVPDQLPDHSGEVKNNETVAMAPEQNSIKQIPNAKHVKVYYEKGKFGGWPANWGIWSWGEEILVAFTLADHKDKKSHTYDRETALAKFARSLDGGNSWTIEDAYEAGINQSTFEHNIGDKSQPSQNLTKAIDFTHPDFAFTFRMRKLEDGPSSFYYSYDRGRNWEGAFKLNVDFTDRVPTGIPTRTDYIIEGKHELTAFLTVGFRKDDKFWREIACVRTTDGGVTWKFLSWIGKGANDLVMPASVRLDSERIITVIRRLKPYGMESFISEDNGYTWKQLKDPVKVDVDTSNPPALLKLDNGQLCLMYGIRKEPTMPDGVGIYITYSSDDGLTWSQPELLRGKDGATWDLGYVRAVQRPDGKVAAVYYYNHANAGDKYRYIAATIF